MILRKPYAILIKYFKVIHLIMTVLMIYIVVKTNGVLTALNAYIKNPISFEVNSINNILNFGVTASLFFIIMGCIIIFLLLRFKKKPKLIYLIMIICYVIVIGMSLSSINLLEQSRTMILDQKTIRFYRDVMIFSNIYQYLIIVIILIRGLGFDIKKFNFRADLDDLNIEMSDNEEFELTTPLNTEKVIRKSRRKIREYKYFIQENKTVFLGLGCMILIIFIWILTNALLNIDPTYNENEIFKTQNNKMNITASFVTNKDYKGNIISKNDAFVIAKFKSSSLINKNVLDLNAIKLVIDKVGYFPTKKYFQQFVDIGVGYSNQEIIDKEKEYILVYQVPRDVINNKMIIRFTNKVTVKNDIKVNYIYVKLNPLNTNKASLIKTVKLNEELDLSNSLLKINKFIISNYEINNRFVYKYNYNNNGENITYTNIIAPLSSSIDKTILKLSLKIDEFNNLQNIDFISNYVSLYQTTDEKETELTFINRTPASKNINENNNVYLEVSNKIEEANGIKLKIKIRQNEYQYILK